MARRLLPIFLLKDILPETDFAVCFDSFYTFFEAQLAAIKTKIIVHCIGPEVTDDSSSQNDIYPLWHRTSPALYP